MARWLLPVVVLVVIATGAAALVARQIYAEPEPAPPSAVVGDERVPPGEQPGDATVHATKDVTAHPLYDTVRGVLQTYFDAINARDYVRWRTVVTSKRMRNEPERDWRVAYRSTRDGNIVIHRIESGPPGTARVLLSFTSVQSPEDAPLELPEPCIRWRVVFPFAEEDGDWKLDSGLTSSAPQHQKC